MGNRINEYKEEIINGVKNMTDEDIMALIFGINQITCEYGWGANLDNNDLIKNLYNIEVHLS